MSNPQSLQALLERPGQLLQSVLRRAQILADYNEKFQRLLPNALKNKVFFLNCDKHQITLGTESAALLTPLRFDAEHLLTALRQLPDLQEIERLRFKIVSLSKPCGKPLPPVKMSEKTGQLLQQAAGAFEDPVLRAALTRLGSRYKP